MRKQRIVNMKIIITEEQYNKLILKEDRNYEYFKRRLDSMLDFAMKPIETDLYGDTFCSNFSAYFNGLMSNLVGHMINHYKVDEKYSITDFMFGITYEKFSVSYNHTSLIFNKIRKSLIILLIQHIV